MWIFLPDSFLSIVDKGDATGKTLLVRGRRQGDIEQVFPNANVQSGGGTDYVYRARIDRNEVADAIATSIKAIRYPNFKNEVTESDRHDAYLDVWSAMYRYQGLK
jgi:hypothetical protein